MHFSTNSLKINWKGCQWTKALCTPNYKNGESVVQLYQKWNVVVEINLLRSKMCKKFLFRRKSKILYKY